MDRAQATAAQPFIITFDRSLAHNGNGADVLYEVKFLFRRLVKKTSTMVWS